jgi:putative transposase
MSSIVSGIVKEPENYIYDSAIDYAGGKGIIPISFIK